MQLDKIDMKIESARIAGGATLVTIWGITLNEWAAIAALCYTALQAFLLLPRVWVQCIGYYQWVRENVFKK